MSCITLPFFSQCFKRLSNPSTQNLRRALYTIGITSLVIGILFFHRDCIAELGAGSYAMGTGLCALGITLLVNTVVYYVKKQIATFKNGGISVKDSEPPIQSVKIIDQCLDPKMPTKPPTSLSFETLPKVTGDLILDLMEIQDVFNFRRVNWHWLQLSDKAFVSAKLCCKYFISFENHDLTKTVLKKFKKAQKLTQSVQKAGYNIQQHKFRYINQVIFKDDRAYLIFFDHVQVWDSELKANQSNLLINIHSHRMVLEGNVLHCYKQHPHLELFSFDILNYSTLAYGVKISLEQFVNNPTGMVFTFSEDKAFAGKGNGTIVVWDLKTKLMRYDDHNVSTLLKGHKDKITNLVYQNNLLYSSAQDDKIKIWNINIGDCLRTIDSKIKNFVVNSRYMCGHFHKANKKTIFNIFEQKTGKCVKILTSLGWIDQYCIHENLLILYYNYRIRIIDLNSGKLLRIIKSTLSEKKICVNLQVFNDKLVALFTNYRETHVFTFDLLPKKKSEQKN